MIEKVSEETTTTSSAAVQTVAAPLGYVVILSTADSMSSAEGLAEAAGSNAARAPHTTRLANGDLGVVAGYFQYTADAELVKKYFADKGFKEIRAVRTNFIEGASYDAIDYLEPQFAPLDVKASQLPGRAVVQADPLYGALEELDKPDTRTEYKNALITARRSVNDDDYLAGYIDTNLGIQLLLEGRYTESERILSNVATGKVAATDVHRLMAMWRLGWLKHQAGDKIGAYRIYSEVERFADNNPRSQIRAIKEKTGLIMELAKDRKIGSLSEVRDYVDYNRDRIDNSPFFDDVATINLMYAETLYYEGKKEEFLNVAYNTLSKMPTTARKQIGTLKVFVGIAEFQLGNPEAGFKNLEDVAEMEFGPNDNWQAIPDLNIHALKWLAHYAKQQNDDVRARRYQDLLDAKAGASL